MTNADQPRTPPSPESAREHRPEPPLTPFTRRSPDDDSAWMPPYGARIPERATADRLA
jgi:hypothetical protein